MRLPIRVRPERDVTGGACYVRLTLELVLIASAVVADVSGLHIRAAVPAVVRCLCGFRISREKLGRTTPFMQVHMAVEAALEVSAAQKSILEGADNRTGGVALTDDHGEAEMFFLGFDGAEESPESRLLGTQFSLEQFLQGELMQLRGEVPGENVLLVNTYLHVARQLDENRQSGTVDISDATIPGCSLNETINVFFV